jgi:predicted XRE-type DNA-binding protein
MNEVVTGSGNFYEDLGLPNAAEMQIKASLAAKIGEIIKHPQLSGMLSGQFRGISEAKILECMNRLGKDVQIVVRKPSRSRVEGHLCIFQPDEK